MEEKRKLPSWMVVKPTVNKVSKPLDADASSVVTSEELRVVKKDIKPRAKDGVTGNRKKSLLVKCETKRRKRKIVEKDVVDGCDSDREVDVEKRKRGRVKRKGEEPEPSRKRSVKSFEFDSGSETEALSCDEDDDELTMDDVLSIAKEFVEKDKRDMGQQKPSEVESELRSKSPPYATSPMRAETRSRQPVETTSNITLADSCMTGDPAQDMLDVFLGSLLKKPIPKDENSSTNNIIVSHETKNQQHAGVVSNKPVTLTKKKSSLRDAVAMFLDSE